MKLFYDMLIPYMPSTIIVDGKQTPNARLEAARKAMYMLAEFQNSHTLNSLYESVYQISIFAEIDIVDLILSLGDVEVPAGKIDDLLDIAAKNLFKTISPDFDIKSFDYKYYAATLLLIAHTCLMNIKQEEAEKAEEPPKDQSPEPAE